MTPHMRAIPQTECASRHIDHWKACIGNAAPHWGNEMLDTIAAFEALATSTVTSKPVSC
jgi:hypothetical protein